MADDKIRIDHPGNKAVTKAVFVASGFANDKDDPKTFEANVKMDGKDPIPGALILFAPRKAKEKGKEKDVKVYKTRRRWLPNLQPVKIIDAEGKRRRVRVCTRCLAAGKITKAPPAALASLSSAHVTFEYEERVACTMGVPSTATR